jgi:hypothetical protein
MLKRIDMKREILFRGYSEALNKWVEGDLVRSPSGQCRIYLPAFEGSSFNTWFQVHPDSVGQFTGLVDMEGNRVFEGHKIEHDIFGKGTIVWDDYTCGFAVEWHTKGVEAPIQHVKFAKITGNTFKPQ